MAMNTNGVQWSIQKKFHDAKDRLLYDTVALKRKVEASSNLNPQVVFAHHPMYTKGKMRDNITTCNCQCKLPDNCRRRCQM